VFEIVFLNSDSVHKLLVLSNDAVVVHHLLVKVVSHSLKVDNLGVRGLESVVNLDVFGSDGVDFSSHAVDVSAEVGVLVRNNNDLVVQVIDGGFRVGESSLQRRALGSKGVQLSIQVVNLD
jgi:hypothetical protein